MRNWRQAALMAGGGVVGGGLLLATGSPFAGFVILFWFAGWAVLTSPLVVPGSTTTALARARSAQDGRPIIFWRPGCTFCLRLRFSLGRVGNRAHWVNIWSDPAAAAAVRAAADGNETVPTVVTADGEAYVNPPPADVRNWVLGQ